MTTPTTGPFDDPLTRRNAGTFVLGIMNAVVLYGVAWALAATTAFTAALVLVTPPAMGFVAAATWGERRYADHTRAKAALAMTAGGLTVAYPLVSTSLGDGGDVYLPVVACLTFVGVVCGMLFAEARRCCRP